MSTCFGPCLLRVASPSAEGALHFSLLRASGTPSKGNVLRLNMYAAKWNVVGACFVGEVSKFGISSNIIVT